MVKTIEQFSGYKLLELYYFNSSKVRQINKNRRKQHSKQMIKNKTHVLETIALLQYYKVFLIKKGFLVLECSTKNGSGSSHILALNFAANYVYESGDQFLRLIPEAEYNKEYCLTMLAKFNVTTVKRVFQVVQNDKIQSTIGNSVSMYGGLRPEINNE
jgi:hypothetical protein